LELQPAVGFGATARCGLWSYSPLWALELQPAVGFGATARCGLWPVEQYLSIFPYLSPTLSIFSLSALEDLFLLLLSFLSWVFLFVSSFPLFE